MCLEEMCDPGKQPSSPPCADWTDCFLNTLQLALLILLMLFAFKVLCSRMGWQLALSDKFGSGTLN